MRRMFLGAAAAFAAWACVGTAMAQAVRWEPDIRFPGTFFPAFAISAAGMDAKGPTDSPAGFGYLSSASFAVKLLEAPPGSKVKVQIEVPEIGAAGDIETVVLPDGKPRYIAPRLSWSQSRLTAIPQPISAEVIFKVYVDGALASEQRRPLRIRAINDSPLRACRQPGQCSDYSPYMAAFVNENHPAIDRILRSTLDIPAMPVKQWTGTQVSEEEVLRQVWAIWYFFQRNKVTYSSITTVSDARQDVMSQTVRPLSQAMSTQQANCIDGTALFSSILRKIGIEPIIVLIPGHAFLGFYVDARNTKPVFLETTMLNDANNPFNQRGPSAIGKDLAKLFGKDVHMQRSWDSFTAAVNEGQAKFAKAQPAFGKQPGYLFVPVMKAREAGILPLPL